MKKRRLSRFDSGKTHLFSSINKIPPKLTVIRHKTPKNVNTESKMQLKGTVNHV